MSTGKKTILAIAGFLAVALIGLSVYFGSGIHAGRQYSRKVTSGDKYLAGGDFNNAILQYQAALLYNDQDADAYLGLANAYIEQDNIGMAQQTLQTGVAKTGSARLQLLLDTLFSHEGPVNKGGTVTVEPVINSDLLSVFGGRNYGDYRTKNGAGAAITSGSAMTVRVDNLGADLDFTNNDAQPHAVEEGNISDTSLPTAISMDNIMILFGGMDSVTYSDLEDLELENLLFTVGSDSSYTISFIKNGCKVTVACDSNGTIHTGAENLIVPIAAVEGGYWQEGQGKAPVSGSIVDATTGNYLPGVTIMARASLSEYGDVVAETVTDGSGEYSMELEIGQYLVEFSKDGYVTVYKELFIDSDSVQDLDAAMSPVLASGEIRIVLEWGSFPYDLDSYLEGSTDNGDSVFVWFGDQSSYGSGHIIAELDLDDRDGNGPETMTIYDTNGRYNFTVRDYTMTGTMAANGATVTVYMPGQSPVTISLSGGSDVVNVWNVCNIDHGQLTVNNTVGD